MVAKLDLVDNVFGKLTVKSFAGKRRTRGGQPIGFTDLPIFNEC